MKLTVLAIFIPAAIALAACGGTSPTANNAPPSNATITVVTPDPNATPEPEILAAGKKLYQTNCAACHKEDGTGGKMQIEGKSINADDLTSAKIKAFPDDKIYGYIYKGIEDEGMPAFKDKLSEAEIREVVRYLRADIQKMPEQLIKPVRSPE